MTTVHLAIPDNMQLFVEGRVKDGRFRSPEEYLLSLIEDDRQRAEWEAKILKGVRSPARELTPEDRRRFGEHAERAGMDKNS